MAQGNAPHPQRPPHVGVLAPPQDGHVRKWAPALARAGARVTVYGLHEAPIPGVQVVALPPPAWPPFWWGGRARFPAFWATAGALRRRLAQDHVDLLHPLYLTPYGAWAASTGRLPVVAAALGADVFDHLPGATGPSWADPAEQLSGWARMAQGGRRAFFRHMVRHSLRRASLVLADNHTLGQALQTGFGLPANRLWVQPFGIDPTYLDHPDPERVADWRHRLNLTPGEPLILVPRGLSPVYQPQLVVAGLAHALQAHPTAKAVLLTAGYPISQDLGPALRALFAAHPGRVWLGEDRLTPPSMAALWTLTRAFVSVPVYDGWSAALAEGRYAGATPVVANLPAYHEEVRHGHTAYILPPHPTGQALGQALLQALAMPAAQRDQWAQANRAAVAATGLLAPNAAAAVAGFRAVLGWPPGVV